MESIHWIREPSSTSTSVSVLSPNELLYLTCNELNDSGGVLHVLVLPVTLD